MEIGVYTFGELALDAAGGRTTHAERTRQLVEEAALADEVGLTAAWPGGRWHPGTRARIVAPARLPAPSRPQVPSVG